MRILLLCILTFFSFSFCGFSQNSPLESLLMKYRLSEISKQPFSKTSLTKSDCEAFIPYLLEQWKEETYARLRINGERKFIQCAENKMPFEFRTFGEVPEEGYSLFISMHGGGNCPKEVNDEQWKNQIELYRPTEGIYVAPRAPWDDWNMWFRPEIDELLVDLIQWLVVSENVNPNRVYLMGYSAGGDGVWRMAPRLADRWAAAAMMAGHPGDAKQENLINVPFMIWVGEKDEAYQRKTWAIRKGMVLDSLERAEPLTYIHQTHIVPDKGHWMDRLDSAAVKWMPNFERDPLPYHIVWQQEHAVRNRMYWIEIDSHLARPGMRVDVVRENNRIEILRCDYPRLRIYLNDEMMNLDEEVEVVMLGKTLFKAKAKRTLGTMSKTLSSFGDYNWMFSTYIDVQIK